MTFASAFNVAIASSLLIKSGAEITRSLARSLEVDCGFTLPERGWRDARPSPEGDEPPSRGCPFGLGVSIPECEHGLNTPQAPRRLDARVSD